MGGSWGHNLSYLFFVQPTKSIHFNRVPTLFRLLCSKITIFNKSSQGAFADQDPTALDFSVNVKLGKLRFVFLGYFVAHLQVCVILIQLIYIP